MILRLVRDKNLDVFRGEMDKVFINLFLSLRCSFLWSEAYLILGKSGFSGVNTLHFSATKVFTSLSKCHHPAGVTWKSKDRQKEHQVHVSGSTFSNMQKAHHSILSWTLKKNVGPKSDLPTPHHMQIWRFWKTAQKSLEIKCRTSNLETSKVCIK